VGGNELLGSLANLLLDLADAVSREVSGLGCLIQLVVGDFDDGVHDVIRLDPVLGGQVRQSVAWQLVAKIGCGLFEERRDRVCLFAEERAEWCTPSWKEAAPPRSCVRIPGGKSGILACACDGLIQLVDAHVQTTGQRLEEFLPRTRSLRLCVRLRLSSCNPYGCNTQNKNRCACEKTLLNEL